MSKKLLELAAEIVQSQAGTGKMAPEEIGLALEKTFAALQRMQKAEDQGIHLDSAGETVESAPEKIDPKNSIQNDKVICLECGAEMRQLTMKHLGMHGLSLRDYKKKWGFPLKQALSAKSLTRARSKAAKKRGIPAGLTKYIEARRAKAEEAPAKEQKVVRRPRKGA